MKKRFLGIICLLYSIMILYVWIFNKLDNFLAPNMQIYLKISLIPLLFMGLVMFFNRNIKYNFKINDLVLLIPFIMIILAGDGRLTASLASNRMMNTYTNEEIMYEANYNKVNEEINDEIEEEIYFDINDKNYYNLANYITYNPKATKYIGKKIKVRGFALKKAMYIKEDQFVIGKYGISCCAADASYMGFFVDYDLSKIEQDEWYEIEGVLEKGIDGEGYDIMIIKAINVEKIDSNKEKQYIYPCYNYDNAGMCEEVTKYNLEY